MGAQEFMDQACGIAFRLDSGFPLHFAMFRRVIAMLMVAMTCATDPTPIVNGSSNNSSPRLRGAVSVDGVAPSMPNSTADAILVEEAALLTGGDQDIKLESGSYYPYHHNWNCYDPRAPSTDGYRGVRGTDSCARECDQTSWCVGFVYMRGQSKCWLRPSGIRCVHSTGGEAASFDWYGSLR